MVRSIDEFEFDWNVWSFPISHLYVFAAEHARLPATVVEYRKRVLSEPWNVTVGVKLFTRMIVQNLIYSKSPDNIFVLHFQFTNFILIFYFHLESRVWLGPIVQRPFFWLSLLHFSPIQQQYSTLYRPWHQYCLRRPSLEFDVQLAYFSTLENFLPQIARITKISANTTDDFIVPQF